MDQKVKVINNFFKKILYKYKTLIKFLISGSIAAITDLFLLFLFTEFLDIHYLLSAVLAFMIAFFVSFYLQKFWTFRDDSKNAIGRQIFSYFFIAIINLLVNTVGMYLLVDKFNIMYIVSQVIMGALIAISSFFIYKFVIFTPRVIYENNN